MENGKKSAIRLRATRGETGERESKFGGKPFIPKGFDYPTIKGKPMVMIAQLNFAELPHLEGYPEEGLLQIYLEYDDGSVFDPDCYKYFYHRDISGENCYKNPFKKGKSKEQERYYFDITGCEIESPPFQFYGACDRLSIEDYINNTKRYKGIQNELVAAYVEKRDVKTGTINPESKAECDFEKAFNACTDYLKKGLDDRPTKVINDYINNVYKLVQNPGVFVFDNDIAPLNPDYEYKLSAEIIGMPDDPTDFPDYDRYGACLIGGTPHSTQDYDIDCGDDKLLLQIDSFDYNNGYENTVMWGDGGVINFFISPSELAFADFSNVYLGGDCY
jgi:hypothetical protein